MFGLSSAPAVPKTSFSLSETSFDPILGEGTILSGQRQPGEPLVVFVDGLEIGRVPPQGSNGSTEFSYWWDGQIYMGLRRTPVLPGSHKVSIVDVDRRGNAMSAPVTIVRRGGTSLKLISHDESPLDFVLNGGFGITFSSSAQGVYQAVISNVQSLRDCPAGPGSTELWRTSKRKLLFGLNYYRWNFESTRLSLSSDYFCVDILAEDAGGRPFSSSVSVPFQYKTVLPVSSVIARPDPPAPALPNSAPPTIMATAFDANRDPVVAREIRIFAAPYSGPGSPNPNAETYLIGTCERVVKCQVAIPNVLRGSGTVSFSATATRSLEFVDSAPRLVDLGLPIGSRPVVRISVPVDARRDNKTISEKRRSNTIDLVYYAGEAYSISSAPKVAEFGRRLASEHDVLLGYGKYYDEGEHGWKSHKIASSLFTNIDEIAFYFSTEPAITSDHGTNPHAICWYGLSAFGRFPSFADVNAIIHNKICRDFAIGGNLYSAGKASISWHEFHHEAFDLTDEYGCGGGYFEDPRTPNVVVGFQRCQAKSEGRSCSRIADPPGCVEAGTPCVCKMLIDYYRIDSGEKDVMIDDTIEQFSDLRAAARVFAECRRGEC